MEKRFLPVGTVVLLKEATKPVMIASYTVFPNNKDQKEMYEYGGYPFPEGIIDVNVVMGFNHEDIEKIIHMGLVNDEQKELSKLLDEHYEEIKEQFKSGKLNISENK